MKLEILAIGRLKQQGEETLVQRYLERINRAGPNLGLKSLNIKELPEAKQESTDKRKNDEAARLLEKTSNPTFLIALDEHGRELTSIKFARLIRDQIDEGTSHMTFSLGGPDGHGKQILEGADYKLSLSKLTMPHGLARITLLEQIYRATTIWSGHPYHRE